MKLKIGIILVIISAILLVLRLLKFKEISWFIVFLPALLGITTIIGKIIAWIILAVILIILIMVYFVF